VRVTNAAIVFVCVLLIGIGIYIRIWWDGHGVSFKFTKWYFAIFLAASLILGLLTYVKVIDLDAWIS
jgi:hypothetical protein